MNPVGRKLGVAISIFAVIVCLSIAGFFIYKQATYKPVPGSCKILEEKYCKQVTFITPSFLPKNEREIQAAYQLPPGTPIFAPFGVDAMSMTGSDLNGFYGMKVIAPFIFMQHTISILNNVQSVRAYTFSFNFKTTQISKKFAKAGDIIARVDGTPVGGEKYTLFVLTQQLYSPTVHPSNFKFSTTNITKQELAP